MERILFLLFILHSLFVLPPMPAAAENQTWKVRPGDTLDVIATTFEIPKENIKIHNPGILESNLQIGQKLKLPLRSYVESGTLEEELAKTNARIGKLDSKTVIWKIKSAALSRSWRGILSGCGDFGFVSASWHSLFPAHIGFFAKRTRGFLTNRVTGPSAI